MYKSLYYKFCDEYTGERFERVTDMSLVTFFFGGHRV